MEKVQIIKHQINGKCRLAIIRTHHHKPLETIREVINKEFDGEYFNEFVDINMDDPWTRIVITNINDLPYQDFDTFILIRERKEKLNKLRK